MSWKSERLMETIRHYANFPATGVSLRQMVQFGQRPSTGLLSSSMLRTHARSVLCSLVLCSPVPTTPSCPPKLTAAGTLFRASQFLSEELPIRLAHRVQELADLPDGLNEMTSIKRVQEWYAQSFEVRAAPVASHCSMHESTAMIVTAKAALRHRSSRPCPDRTFRLTSENG